MAVLLLRRERWRTAGLLSVSVWGKVCCLHVIPSIGLSAGWNCRKDLLTPHCNSQGHREDLRPSAFILSLQRDRFPATLTAPVELVFCGPSRPHWDTEELCVAARLLPGASGGSAGQVPSSRCLSCTGAALEASAVFVSDAAPPQRCSGSCQGGMVHSCAIDL